MNAFNVLLTYCLCFVNFTYSTFPLEERNSIEHGEDKSPPIIDLEKTGFTLEQGIPHFNTKPYFLPPVTTNFTSLSGQSAYLHCRVAQLGDKKVSWIRRRDLHVLTSGLHTFSSDDRFQALHQERSENWTLHIRFSQVRDSGEYKCQVNTEPRITLNFYLIVKEAAANISGSDQRYVRAGSEIRLSCKTNIPSPPPGLLYWYRNSDLVQNSARISVSTTFAEIVTSHLVIKKASKSDSGNYTCWPTKFQPSSVTLHVIRDEEPAAMAHGTPCNGGTNGAAGTRTEPTKCPPLSSPSGDMTSSSSTKPTQPSHFYLFFSSFLVFFMGFLDER